MENKLLFVTKNMKALRIRAGLLQEDVAKQLNVSRVTYCSYETNPQKVTLEILYELAELYKCKLTDFFVEINVT